MNYEIYKARVRALAAQVHSYPHERAWMVSPRTCLLHHATRLPMMQDKVATIMASKRAVNVGYGFLLVTEFEDLFGLPGSIPLLSRDGPTSYTYMATPFCTTPLRFGVNYLTGPHVAAILLAEIGECGPTLPESFDVYEPIDADTEELRASFKELSGALAYVAEQRAAERLEYWSIWVGGRQLLRAREWAPDPNYVAGFSYAAGYPE